jgi:hypothetical protein
MGTDDWIDLKKDAETGIETIRAHFEGHAYDPHFHDSYLIGFTEQGVQQFHCRRTLHSSTPGQVFLLEPGELHDGHAPTAGGFTYSMLYLDPHWIERELRALFEDAPNQCQPAFAKTLESEPELVTGSPMPARPCKARTCASFARPRWTRCWASWRGTCHGDRG